VRAVVPGGAYRGRVVAFLLAVLPSAGVLFLFWLGVKALVEGDRRERLAQARIERRQDLEQQARERAAESDRVQSDPMGDELER
jgi:threonine/homoserine/homoserine lactone efflux protein